MQKVNLYKHSPSQTTNSDGLLGKEKRIIIKNLQLKIKLNNKWINNKPSLSRLKTLIVLFYNCDMMSSPIYQMVGYSIGMGCLGKRSICSSLLVMGQVLQIICEI